MSSCAELIDVLQHNDTHLHGYSEQGEEAHSARDAEVRASEQERQQPPDGGHGHVRQKEQSPFEGTKHRVENAKDHEHSQGHNDEQPRLRSLLTFVFACPVDVIATRKPNFRGHFLDSLLDRAAQIPPSYTVLDRDVPLILFTVDLRSTIAWLDLTQLRQ